MTFDNAGSQIVVHSGDTLVGIATEQCGASSSDSVISDLGIDPTRLLPGENAITVQCDTSEAGQQSAEITTANAELSNFVTKYGAYADAAETKYGVPRALTLAMSALESGYGTSEIAVNAHNFHGLKANDEWFGPTYEQITPEVVSKDNLSTYDIVGEAQLRPDGLYDIQIRGIFKQFPSDQEGFRLR